MFERRKGAHARNHAAPARRRRAAPRKRRPRLAKLRPAYPRPGRQGFRRWVPSWRQALGSVLTFAGLLTALVTIMYVRTEIPADLNAFATQQDNVYYWADGTEMARTGEVNRQDLDLRKVPEKVRWAALAAENETFYSDSGISLSGMTRAVTKMVTGGSTQGGSTITQQYVKNAYLNQDQTFSRKFTEMFIAIKLDNQMSKDEILEGYLNTSWYGRGTYGIQRAAHAYYGKDVSQLNASEGAFLASLLKGAGLFDPSLGPKNHERAVERWNWILDRMVTIGKLSKEERATYTTFPEPQAPPKPAGLTGQTGYLVETARAYVSAHTDVSDHDFDLGGYQIRTTFEKPRMAALTKAVAEASGRLDAEKRDADKDVRIGAASVTTDGRVVALYGGPDYLKQGFNDANSSVVPAGTSFTPFVYAAALREGVQKERGKPRTPVSPATVYNGDDKISLLTPEGPYWSRSGKIVKALNDGGKSWGRITLKEAVAQSVNTPMMQLGMDVGLDQVGETAVAAGLLKNSLGQKLPGFSLGTATPSAIRMAGAYGTFAAGGLHSEPYSVDRLSRNGNPVPVEKPKAERVLPAQVAGAVDDALRDAVLRGSAAAAKAAGAGAAGKTGTAQDNKSAWFAGYRGKVSTAVSLSRIDPRSQELQPLDGLAGAAKDTLGSTIPIDIWTKYTAAQRS
ncbi:transglycosylase domain-containing protein [Streptomyces eurocidicus]|uniref:Membrane peptidoglycan carboxypeptidase n=1 Tax=Streptomyces eurocidicus TaxID=66423 RepID=A0A7W8F109_STREU|nr:transglycosylase domain-containing protein [Streptomyces eurocidicus]MBB5119163.1 membrane peptidoglycan carboxypeptidase [Streptomyces eurocidicus]MBF6051735.1 penicillin-binding protein [Streptomyces eurocidicus]